MNHTDRICQNCRHRNAEGYCTNSKLCDDIGQDAEFREDALLYQFSEGGNFIVGDYFGCVHFEETEANILDPYRTAEK